MATYVLVAIVIIDRMPNTTIQGTGGKLASLLSVGAP